MAKWFKGHSEKTEQAQSIAKAASDSASEAITKAKLQLDKALRELAAAKARTNDGP